MNFELADVSFAVCCPPCLPQCNRVEGGGGGAGRRGGEAMSAEWVKAKARLDRFVFWFDVITTMPSGDGVRQLRLRAAYR